MTDNTIDFTVREKTTHIILHCSDSPQGRGDNSETIDKWHRERGFDCIGYHAVGLEDGTVEAGRPLDVKGAHCRDGGMNHVSIGYCYIGKPGEMNIAQKQAFALFVFVATQLFPEIEIVTGHNTFNKEKTCPGYTEDQINDFGADCLVDRLKLSKLF